MLIKVNMAMAIMAYNHQGAALSFDFIYSRFSREFRLGGFALAFKNCAISILSTGSQKLSREPVNNRNKLFNVVVCDIEIWAKIFFLQSSKCAVIDHCLKSKVNRFF